MSDLDENRRVSMRRTTMIGIAALSLAFFLGGTALAGDEPAREEPAKAAAADKGPAAEAPKCPRSALEGAKESAAEAGEHAHARLAEFQKQVGGAVGLLAVLAGAGFGGLSLSALLALLLITFPGAVRRVREAAEARPYVSPALGGANALFTGLLVGALGHAGGGLPGLLGLLILLAFSAVGILGLAGKAQSLGSQLLTLADRRPNPVANLAVGWPMLFLVGTIPVVGWVIFGYWTLSGVGAVMVSLFGKGKAAAPPQGGAGDRIIVDAPKFTV
jgi:hypothetical protein